MGLKSSIVKIKVSNMAKRYEDLGYNVPKRIGAFGKLVYDIGNTFEIKVEDLSPSAHIELEYICDICGNTFISNNINLRKCSKSFCKECTTSSDGTISKLKSYNSPPISETDEWAIEYFVDKNIPKKYLSGSHSNAEFICSCCNQKYIKGITYVISSKQSLCNYCKDGISYPNKFLKSLLDQLNIEARYEYSPKWAKPFKYDTYFIINNKEYIVEMDGGLGHGKRDFNGGQDSEGLQRDLQKDKLANDKNISLIRINADISSIEYLKKEITNSELSNILNLNKIDWIKCGSYASSSLLKEVCNYYNQTTTNEEKSPAVIGKYFDICRDTVRDYLKKGNELGICIYTPEIAEQVRKDNLKKGIVKNMKPIYVYDLNHTLVHSFDNINDCVEFMSNTYGKKFIIQSVRAVCNGVRNSLYGFIFSYNN